MLASPHAMFRDGMVCVLRAESGLEVIAQPTSGEQAVSQHRTLKPDLVILDLALPGREGIEAARAIFDHKPGARIIVLSVNKDRALVREAMGMGVSACISRSCPVSELVEVVRAVAAGRSKIIRGISVDEDTPTGGLPVEVTASRAHTELLAQLTPRELEVLVLLAGGKNTKEAAHLLGLSPKTVETHRIHLYEKLDCQSVVALSHLAIQAGLIKP
jgi:DNA-binding NarL/FixJ family response regulator